MLEKDADGHFILSMSNTKSELLHAAEQMGVQIHYSWKKQDILNELLAVQKETKEEDQAEQEAFESDKDAIDLEDTESVAVQEVDEVGFGDVIEYMRSSAATDPVSFDELEKNCGVTFAEMQVLCQQGKVSLIRKKTKILFKVNR